MKTRTILLAAAVLLAPAAAVAQGGLPSCNTNATTSPFGSARLTSPFLWAFVNNECTDLSSYIVSAQGGQVWSVNSPTLQLGAGSVQVRSVFDSDPFITFGATTINLSGSPVTFAFLFGTPVIPGSYDMATSTGGVSVTNGARGTTTVSTSGIHPTFISGYGTVGFSPTNLGVDLGTASCIASGVPFTVTTTCNQGTTTNSFGPTFYDNLEGLLTYTQDDLSSVASWSGAVTLTVSATPEPATIGLFGVGLVAIGGVARRRRTS
ncbi:MAG: PEP-CTERM sorting domain-containing protein [Gemmatimonadaceae bacterium]